MQSDINKSIEKLLKAVTIIGRDIERVEKQIETQTKIIAKMYRLYEKEAKYRMGDAKAEEEQPWQEMITL